MLGTEEKSSTNTQTNQLYIALCTHTISSYLRSISVFLSVSQSVCLKQQVVRQLNKDISRNQDCGTYNLHMNVHIHYPTHFSTRY